MRNEELRYRLRRWISCSVGATFGRCYRTFLSLIKIVSDQFNMCVNIEFT